MKRAAHLKNSQCPKYYTTELKQVLSEKIPLKKQEAKELREKYGNVVITQSTVDMAFKGMRGIKGLVTETSLLDADEGIRFRFVFFNSKRLQEVTPSQNVKSYFQTELQNL
jgi:hypothetical protein